MAERPTLRGSDEEARREAARLLGSSRSPAKLEAIAKNAKLGGRPKGMKVSEETRAKLRARWAERKARKESEKEGTP